MQVRLYGMFGQRLPGGFSLGEEVARDGVERAELYGGGLVVLTRRHGQYHGSVIRFKAKLIQSRRCVRLCLGCLRHFSFRTTSRRTVLQSYRR